MLGSWSKRCHLGAVSEAGQVWGAGPGDFAALRGLDVGHVVLNYCVVD